MSTELKTRNIFQQLRSCGKSWVTYCSVFMCRTLSCLRYQHYRCCPGLNASNLGDVFIFKRVVLPAFMLATGRRMGGNWAYWEQIVLALGSAWLQHAELEWLYGWCSVFGLTLLSDAAFHANVPRGLFIWIFIVIHHSTKGNCCVCVHWAMFILCGYKKRCSQVPKSSSGILLGYAGGRAKNISPRNRKKRMGKKKSLNVSEWMLSEPLSILSNG